MVTREVEYAILGAGIAGRTLRRFLASSDVVVLDVEPEPDEGDASAVPLRFAEPAMRALATRIAALPSASASDGTLFVDAHGVSQLPRPSCRDAHDETPSSLHVDALELAHLVRDAFPLPAAPERMVEIDLAAKRIRTDRSIYRVRGPILDCSGSAAIVARALGTAHELWPAWSASASFDVDRVDDDAFRRWLLDSRRTFRVREPKVGVVVPRPFGPACRPSHHTMLTRVRPGVWAWQVPLHDGTRLRFGVVSQHGPVTADELAAVAREALGAHCVAHPRPRDGSPLDALRTRERFAWASTRFARDDFALVGDAAFFADPAFSRGAGFSVTHALHLARLLEGGWSAAEADAFERHTQALLQSATRASAHWFDESTRIDDAVASDLHAALLAGHATRPHDLTGGDDAPRATAREELELQLGHLCNDRCVFCVSGKRTRAGDAPLLDTSMLLARLESARRAGARRVTLLGGEPTIQPAFEPVVRAAVALGFDEVVVFSNGSKLARTDLIDRVLATGGNFEWRLSFQGGTEEGHDRTTGRRGSFAQLTRTLARLSERAQKITINTCVVTTNAGSLPGLADALGPHAVHQVHLDMLNPFDTGTMTDGEVRAIQPRYSELVEPLTQTIAAFPAGFPIHIGNLPFCVAPALAPWIHHGGSPTWTVTAGDSGATPRALPKYLVKASGHRKAERCSRCLLESRCTGFFEPYLRWFGDGELAPITPERLASEDPHETLLALHLDATLRRALATLPAPFDACTVDTSDVRRVELRFTHRASPLRLGLRLERGAGGVCATRRFHVRVLHHVGPTELLARALDTLFTQLVEAGEQPIHPPARDAFDRVETALARQLAQLRSRAPFGALVWHHASLTPRRLEVQLRSPEGEDATLWLAHEGGRMRGGYRVHDATSRPASEALREGLREALDALSVPRSSSAPPGSRDGEATRS